jgi:anthranilate synthase component 1
MGNGAYQRAVEVAKEHILAGDIFQVVLAQRFDFELDADPFDLYRVLRQVNPSPYMYFLRHPDVTIVGSSPEPMVQVLDGRVISRPIASTRRRSPSTSCSWTSPATTWAASSSSAPCTSTSCSPSSATAT